MLSLVRADAAGFKVSLHGLVIIISVYRSLIVAPARTRSGTIRFRRTLGLGRGEPVR